MAKSILVANWKNHPGSIDEAKSLLAKLAKKPSLYKKLSFFIAPPYPYLDLVKSKARSFSSLASQDFFTPLETGSYTGQVTPNILKSLGVKLSILGHSERRAEGESSQDVSGKVRLALRSGFTPLVCVGEKTRDKDGLYYETLRKEIKESLANLENKKSITKVMIAYEPIWAIGKSAEEAIDARDLAQSVIFIKKVLSDLFGREYAKKVSILYGGSVEPDNATALLEKTGINGFLVGHASLNAKDLEVIARALV